LGVFGSSNLASKPPSGFTRALPLVISFPRGPVTVKETSSTWPATPFTSPPSPMSMMRSQPLSDTFSPGLYMWRSS
jgi:hypothetical protein